MNGFLRTLVAGLAALCLILVAAGVTVVVRMKSGGAFDPKALRDLVLSDEEKEWLAKMRERAPEPPPVQHQPPANEQEMLGHISEMANAAYANQLIAKLKRQQEALDERQAWIDQQYADLQLAKSGGERLQRQLQAQDQQLRERLRQEQEEHARWAAVQVAEKTRLDVLGAVEKARYKDQARLFEAMKDAAWQSLRRFDPREIARYLAFMDDKKAARILVLAQQDPDLPGIAPAIHKEMLHQDLERSTGDQLARLAQLYAFMPTEQILPFLKEAPDQEVADTLKAMAVSGQVKKRAEILEGLRAADSKRELQIRHLLEQDAPADGKVAQ
jgi:hypothetical protein